MYFIINDFVDVDNLLKLYFAKFYTSKQVKHSIMGADFMPKLFSYSPIASAKNKSSIAVIHDYAKFFKVLKHLNIAHTL